MNEVTAAENGYLRKFHIEICRQVCYDISSTRKIYKNQKIPLRKVLLVTLRNAV